MLAEVAVYVQSKYAKPALKIIGRADVKPSVSVAP